MRPSSRRSVTVGALLLALGLVTLVSQSSSGVSGAPPLSLARSSTLAGPDSGEQLDLPEQPIASSQVQPPEDGLELLEEYWGSEWPIVREELLSDGVDLGQLPPIWQWSEAFQLHDDYLTLSAPGRIEMVFSRMFAWSRRDFHFGGQLYSNRSRQWKTDAAFLASVLDMREALQLDPAQAHEVLEEVEPINQELELLLADYIPRLELRLRQKLALGLVKRAPLIGRPAWEKRSSKGLLYNGCLQAMGWSVDVELSLDEAPDLAALSERIDSLKEDRFGLARAKVHADLDPGSARLPG